MEGFQRIGRHIFGSQRLLGGWLLWGRGWLFWTFGTALMPLRPCVLAPPFATVA